MLYNRPGAPEGFEVWVETADGQRLSEYEYTRPPADEGAGEAEAKEENPLRQRCWLETPAVAESVFQVCYSLPKYTQPRSVHLFIEGTHIKGSWYRFSGCANGTFRTMVDETSNGENQYEYKLAFDYLVTSDSPQSLQNLTRCKNLGEITITVDEGYTTSSWEPPSYENPSKVLDIRPASESFTPGNGRIAQSCTLSTRSIIELKIPPHMLKLSGVQGVPVSKPDYTPGGHKETYHRDVSKKAYSFTFVYASRDFLMARDIIEKDPEVKAQEAAQEQANRDRRAEIRKKKRRQNKINDLQRELLRLQAEAEDPDSKPDVSITVHDLADKRKSGRETTPIDLTEDD